ncbi:hypothetical protein GE061_019236 [Apolygus lucorum]|uniref:Uncharacterized protein n=1 Tax=Apolygus lucorum TaxID=248454 RepID=A0A8S9X952_APOLU|nr:hypothetical protein GE061_019236 [Apolygus lucorum]
MTLLPCCTMEEGLNYPEPSLWPYAEEDLEEPKVMSLERFIQNFSSGGKGEDKKDCLECRLVGGLGCIGIGCYIAAQARGTKGVNYGGLMCLITRLVTSSKSSVFLSTRGIIMEQDTLLEALKQCLVPPCVHGNDRPITDSDFEDYKSVIDDQIALASKEFLSSTSTIHLRDDVISTLVVVCGQHSTQSPWTTDVSVALCQEIFDSFASGFYEQNERTVFQEPKFMKKSLILLRPHLLSTTFKCNPAAVIAYSWILKKMQSPFLGECLSDLLPSALIISDDFEPQNIKIGFDCLHHIIENVALERLKYFGQDEVIVDALKKSLYQTDPEIVASQLPCYVALMRKYLQHSTSLKANQFDDVIKTVLFNMYVENKYQIRRIYATNIPAMIEARGPGVIRHLSMLFKVLSEYALEPTTTVEALKALGQMNKVPKFKTFYFLFHNFI